MLFHSINRVIYATALAFRYHLIHLGEKLEPVGYSGAAMTAAVLSAWQPPQSFVPMLQGKGALSSWTPATWSLQVTNWSLATRHYVVAANSHSKAIMFFSAMPLLTGLTSLACFCLRYSLRWHLRSSPLKRFSLRSEE